MKFDLISDVHIDMNPSLPDGRVFDWDRYKQSDILVVAGDTGDSTEFAKRVLEDAAKVYSTILYVDGNHEHHSNANITAVAPWAYNYTITGLENICASIPQATYLPRKPFEIDGTLFIGRCGWYDFAAAEGFTIGEQILIWVRNLRERNNIGFTTEFLPSDLAEIHANELAAEVTAAQERDDIKEIVVVTHTIPHRSGAVEQGHDWYPLNGSFVNTKMERVWQADLKKKIITWVFGHTHFYIDFTDNGIRFVTNPRGIFYERQHVPFRGTIQIDTTSSGVIDA